MGCMDDYAADSGGGEGIKRLTVLEFKTVFSSQKGTEGKAFIFFKDNNPERKMYKTLYASKMFNRFFTGYIQALGLDPAELEKACKNGNGDDWLAINMPGRSGDFDCRYGEPNQEGKKYLEPMVKAELDFKEWIASQDGSTPPIANRQAQSEPPIDSYQEQSYPDDIPY